MLERVRRPCSRHVRRTLAMLCAGLLLSGPARAWQADELAHRQIDGARLYGTGVLRHYGQTLYTARLYVDPGRFAARQARNEAFMLDLEWAEAIDGAVLASFFAREMRDMGLAGREAIDAWQGRLNGLLPALDANDHLSILYRPAEGCAFFVNGEPIGMLRERAFADAFFGLWFDPETTMPLLRQQLLHPAPGS